MRPYDLTVRAYRAARFGARTLQRWRTLSESLGVRPAFFEVVRTTLGVDHIDPLAWEQQRQGLTATAEALEAQRQTSEQQAKSAQRRLDELSAHTNAARDDLDRVDLRLDQLDANAQVLGGRANLLDAKTAELDARAGQLDARVVELGAGTLQLDARAAQLDSGVAALSTRVEQLSATLEQLGSEKARLERELQSETAARETERDHFTHRLDLSHARFAANDRLFAFAAWVESAQVPTQTRLTVILVTRDRSQLLTRAVASVRAQTLSNFELLVVDDGSTDDTAQVVEQLAALDPRIRLVRGAGAGLSTARNQGLGLATGSIITYLDDDNAMMPQWLKAVAWAFENRADVDVLYGARLMERETLDGPVLPTLHFEPFDRVGLENHNFIDMGVLAHRAGLKEAHFNETLTACVDWDLVLRLTRHKPALALPVLALAYHLDAPGRISQRPKPQVEIDKVRQMHRRLKVLAYNDQFPLLTESYISDEAQALVRHGAHLSYCREAASVLAPARVAERVFTNFDLAIATVKPDVLLLHWATHARKALPRLERAGVPFGLRVHSFDFDVQQASQLLRHPLCIGVWAYPHHAAQIPGAHALPSLFTSHDRLHEPSSKRELVLSVSAGLPKKNFDLLIDAMAGVPDAERRIVVGITNGFETVPSQVAEKLKRLRVPPLLQVNLERDEVFALLARAAVLIYTLEPGFTFGMPMSIIEAMTAGVAVVVPDRPEARALCGPAFRGYTSAADITAHITEVLAGGPRIEAERAANRAWALEQYCNPTNEARFAQQFTAALRRWQAARATPEGVVISTGPVASANA